MKYSDFLQKKERQFSACGFDCVPENKFLFEFQRDIIKWALKKGKSALFLDTGLGKTICQLVWADEVCKHTSGNVLILAPLAVADQTVREGEKFGINVNICRNQENISKGINITNYEMIDHFECSSFVGVVLDESSILKSFTGSTTKGLIDKFKFTDYKLACTATPSPNDYEELGNHSEFLGVCTRSEMLAEYFMHDGGETSKWRLKGHAINDYWKWVSSWAMVLKNPSDLGYDGTKYTLPKLNITYHFVKSPKPIDSLIPISANTLEERREARKESIIERVKKCKDLVDNIYPSLIWCDYNDEGHTLKKNIDGSVEIKGSDTNEFKKQNLLDFSDNKIKCLITKPKIAGFGMNWQNCNNVIFCGLSDSYERYYQAIRRCYRFGQKKEVNVHIVISEKEDNVVKNIQAKEKRANEMSIAMVNLTAENLKSEIKNTKRITNVYMPSEKIKLPMWI